MPSTQKQRNGWITLKIPTRIPISANCIVTPSKHAYEIVNSNHPEMKQGGCLTVLQRSTGIPIFSPKAIYSKLDAIWKLLFPQNESSSNPFTLSQCRALCWIREQKARNRQWETESRIVQIEIPYKVKPAVGIWPILLEEAPFLRGIVEKDS